MDREAGGYGGAPTKSLGSLAPRRSYRCLGILSRVFWGEMQSGVYEELPNSVKADYEKVKTALVAAFGTGRFQA